MSKPEHPSLQQQIPAPVPAYQQQYGQQPQPAMVYQCSDDRIAQYQKEIDENQISCTDFALFFICCPVGFMRIISKRNRLEKAMIGLAVELAKV
ncbi:hypothetical protein BGZ89_002000 [Linnemannia elongata]|nr:hypothetical protein BGZ89_002000 [Linnemannia elongata]